jgi:histidinol-phosphate/aromatic aminotransferase/cobyric acid decarboxylase-like protein
VISDEIYARLAYDNRPVHSIAALPGKLERTIIVDGFSKTYAMTGWRLGYAIMPEALAERVELLLTHSVGCTATFTQIAGIEASPLIRRRLMLWSSNTSAAHRGRRVECIPGVRCQCRRSFLRIPNI